MNRFPCFMLTNQLLPSWQWRGLRLDDALGSIVYKYYRSRTLRDLRRFACFPRYSAVWHVECEADRSVWLGYASWEDQKVRDFPSLPEGCGIRLQSVLFSGTVSATVCWWRPCPRRQQPRFSATMSRSSPTPRTSTAEECCRVTSRLWIHIFWRISWN